MKPKGWRLDPLWVCLYESRAAVTQARASQRAFVATVQAAVDAQTAQPPYWQADPPQRFNS